MKLSKSSNDNVVITGAFSYTGSYATHLLLNQGFQVRTLTNHPDRHNPFGQQMQVFPYNFDCPSELRKALSGASTLINTYWVRFPHGDSTFETAVSNTQHLIAAAKDAGVERIVHVSIANPSADSPLGYYRGKAKLEQAIFDSGLSYAILRPTVIFGLEDILINNIAWFLRRFPIFGIPGDGLYRIRPIYVGDMAQLLCEAASGRVNSVIDAVGPESYTFEELVRLISQKVRRSPRLIHLPASAAYLATRITGWFVGDVVLTWQEYRGLMGNLLAPNGPPAGQTHLSDWLDEHHPRVGLRYASEIARHY